MRLRKVEIVEGEDGIATVEVTVADAAGALATYSFTGNLKTSLYVRDSYAHIEASVSPVKPQQHSAETHNSPSSKFQ